MFFLLSHVQLPVPVLLVVLAGVVLVPPASVLRPVVSIPTSFVPVPAGRGEGSEFSPAESSPPEHGRSHVHRHGSGFYSP